MADMEYTVDLNEAIQAFNNLNQAINQVNASGRSSKKKLQPIIDEIEGLKNVLSGAPAEIDALVASLKKIAINPTTMKGSLRELSAALEAAAKNMKRGTAAMVAVKNQETFSLKRELDRQVELQEKATAKIEAALNREDRLRTLQGLKPLNPQLKYTDPDERTAVLEGLRRKEDEAAETHHTKQRAREAKTTAEFEKQAIEREAIQRRLIEQGTREARTFDSFSSVGGDAKSKFDKFVAAAKTQGAEIQKLNLKTFNQGLADATKAYNDEAELKAAAINERIKQTQEGEKRTQDILDDSAEINAARIQASIDLERKFRALAAKERAKNEQKIIAASKEAESLTTKQFQTEVNKRIKAARDFEDAKRSGFTKSQFDSLKGGKLDDLETGARVSSGAPRDQFEAAAVKQMAENFKAAKTSQDEVIAGAKRLGIPLRENVERAKEFTLSWKAMGRIVVAQAFNQAFFAMQNAIRASVNEAEDLYKAIAEIQTIVDQSSRGASNYYGALESILQASSKINFTPQDTANAFYETLSNQIGDSVSQIGSFIQEAGNLGKVTRSTLAQSADAITAVMNSYNKGVGEAATISAELFTLVDQGRVKLDEVANHMGNVSVPASQLGVDFDNVVAALSAISIAGIPAREAMTLQRNVMFKLIDPTEKMVELFGEWGVSSAQAAVAAFGFEGIIQRLGVEAEKGNEEIAALMGTIRGTRGILGLTGENFQKYQDALEASRTATETYSKTVEEYLSNPGEKFAKLQQEISNEFIRMGARIVDITVKFNDFIQGTNTGESILAGFIGTTAKLTIVLGGAGAAFLVTASAIAAMASAYAALTFAIGVGGAVSALALASSGIGLVAAVAVGAVLEIAAFSKSAEQEFGEIQANAAKMNKDVAKSFEEGILGALDERSEHLLQKSKAALASVANTIADINKEAKALEAKKALDDLASGLDRLIRAFGGSDADQKMVQIFSSAQDVADLYGNSANWTTDGIDALTDAHEKEADAIQKVIDKLQEQRDKLADTATNNRIALAENITERNINNMPLDIFDPYAKGRAQLQAAQSAANAGAQATSPEESERLFKIAQKFLADAERTAFETGAFGTIQKHTQFFNQQEAELVAMQERRLAAEDAMIAKKQESLDQQRQYHQTQKEIGQAEIDRRKELETQFQLEKAFLDEYLRQRDLILKDKALPQEEKVNRLNTLTDQARQGLDKIGASDFTRQQFEAELNKNQATVATEALRSEEEELTKVRQDASVAVNEAIKETEAYGDKLEEIATRVNTAIGILDSKTNIELAPAGPGGVPIIDENKLNLMRQADALKAEADALAKQQAIDADQATTQEEKLALEQQYLEKLAELHNRAVALSNQSGIQDPSINRELQAAFDQIELANIQRQTAIDLTTQANILMTELDRLTNSVSAAANAISNRPPLANYYATGGPVGTDTIPAWLSPGEFVVRAQSARKNFDVLQAINAGTFQRFANGGSVSNSQVFSSTFNMKTTNPQMQAAQIMSIMKRQISQGKATLGKGRPY